MRNLRGLYRIAAMKTGIVGLVACLFTTACAKVEYTAPKRNYSVHKVVSDNEMQLMELSRTKPDPLNWGTLHFGGGDEPDEEGVAVDLGKEKHDYRPSRYFARTYLPEVEGKRVGFTFAVDSKRDAFMGFELNLKRHFWSPSGALK